MKRILLFLGLLASCYDPNKPAPCDPHCAEPRAAARPDAGAKFGASLIYPGRNISSTGITDSTTIGRSILTASSAASIRTILGLSNLTDLENDALAHANSVVTFLYPQFLWHAPAVQRIGSGQGNNWTSLLGGTCAATVQSSGERGGATSITTGATAASDCQLISVVNGLGIFGGSFIDDVTASTAKWHFQIDLKVTTTPDAQTIFNAGWIKPDGTAAIRVGLSGASSTGFYRLFTEGGTGVTGNIARDAKRHRFRVWHDGAVAAGTFNWSVDGVVQTALTGVTQSFAAAPYFHITNGSTAAAQTVVVYDAIFQGDGVPIPPP